MQGLPQLNFGAGDVTRGIYAGVRAAESKSRRKLIENREDRESEEFDSAKAGLKAQRMISVLEAKSPEHAAILNAVHFPKTKIQWQGDNVQLEREDGTTVSGPKAPLITMQKMQMANADPQDVHQYGVENGVLFSNPKKEAEERAKTIQEAAVQMFLDKPPEEQTEENFFRFMGEVEAFGKEPKDPRTAQMKNAEALSDPDTDPEVRKNLAALLEKKGMAIDVGEDGSVRIVQGTGSDMQSIMPNRSTENKVQEKLFNAYEATNRLDEIVKTFKPEFLEVPTKLGIKWNQLASKFGKRQLDPMDEKQIEEFGVFKQNAINNLNLYIKELTGAQMSNKEANRLRKGLPDPGEGLFDGMDPITFKSTLINTIKQTKMAIARYNLMLKQGLDSTTADKMVNGGAAMSLEDVESMMKESFEEYKKSNPKMDLKTIAGMVQRDFGLVK